VTVFADELSQVESIYVSYFGRAGDPSGASYWVQQRYAGAPLSVIAASFATQPEALTKYPYLAYPYLADPGAFVDAVYQNSFSHGPDAAGRAYWIAQLNAAGGNPTAVGQFILNVISGATGTDSTALTNKVDVARDFTTKASNAGTAWSNTATAQSSAELATVTDQAATVVTAKAATDAFIASAPASPSNFTLGIDTLTSNVANATFNALLLFNPGTGTMLQSLQTGDSATDTAPATGPGLSNGGNLVAMLNSATPVDLVSLKGIPTHSVTSLAVGAGYGGDITGLTTLTNSNSTGSVTVGAAGNGIDKGGVAGTTTMAGTLLGTINVSNSPASGANTLAIVNAAALAGTADAIAVNLIGAVGAATPGTGAAQIVAQNDSAAGTAAAPNNAYEVETITAGANSFLQLSNASSGILSTTSLRLAGAGALQLSAAAAGDFARLTSIDATMQAGGVSITGPTDISPTGAAFNAGVAGLLTANSALTSFSGGSGADRLDLSGMTAAQIAAFSKLDGGTGLDTLVFASAVMNTTVFLPNAGFETIAITAGLTGTSDLSKLGSDVSTLQLLGLAAGTTITLNNAPSVFTLDLGAFGNGKDYTIAGPSAAADALMINARSTGSLSDIAVTGYETVTLTFAGTGNGTFDSLTATPSAGVSVVVNIVDAIDANGDLTIAQSTNAGTGTINVFGSAEVTLSNGVTAGALSGAGMTGNGHIIMSRSTAPISIAGGPGADMLVGSPGTDTISGGAGNDILFNMDCDAGGAAVMDTLTGGAGSDSFGLVGDRATAAIPGIYDNVTVITDMTVGPSAATSDFITLSTDGANYAVTLAAGYPLQAIATVRGSVPIQAISSSAGANAILNATSEVLKLTGGVATAGLSLQAAFNAAIGTTTITGATQDAAYFFTFYDATNGRLVMGIVQDHNGSDTTIEAGDIVSILGSAPMSAADYANINANHFSIIDM
jgi:hypothetical protein